MILSEGLATYGELDSTIDLEGMLDLHEIALYNRANEARAAEIANRRRR